MRRELVCFVVFDMRVQRGVQLLLVRLLSLKQQVLPDSEQKELRVLMFLQQPMLERVLPWAVLLIKLVRFGVHDLRFRRRMRHVLCGLLPLK